MTTTCIVCTGWNPWHMTYTGTTIPHDMMLMMSAQTWMN
jgi:hypothetical protein